MPVPEGMLFDPTPYTEPRLLLPERLGKRPGDYLGLTRFVEIELEDDPLVFSPVTDENQVQVILNGESRLVSPIEAVTHTAEGYATSSGFDSSFTEWYTEHETRESLSGYLVGFPILRRGGISVNTLHYWANDESIFDDTRAVQLSSIRSLTIFSLTITRLALELDHLGMASLPQYRVPLLFNPKNDEVISRVAGQKDIMDVFEVLKNEKEHRTVIFKRAEDTAHVWWADSRYLAKALVE
jgi:hypothetical protein